MHSELLAPKKYYWVPPPLDLCRVSRTQAVTVIKFIIALSALVMSTMPLLALDETQQTLIDNFARAYIANRDCDYPLNADRIADDLAKAGLSMADLGKATANVRPNFSSQSLDHIGHRIGMAFCPRVPRRVIVDRLLCRWLRPRVNFADYARRFAVLGCVFQFFTSLRPEFSYQFHQPPP